MRLKKYNIVKGKGENVWERYQRGIVLITNTWLVFLMNHIDLRQGISST